MIALPGRPAPPRVTIGYVSGTTTVDRALRAALYDDTDPALDTGASLLAADPAADGELARRGEQLLAAAWRRGWQPADVARIVRRELDDRHVRLVSMLILQEAGKRPSPGPRWAAQLQDLDRQPPRAIDRFSHATAVLKLYRLLVRLPALEPLEAPEQSAAQQQPESRMLTRIRALLAKDLRVQPDPEQLGAPPRPPVFVLVVVALTLAGFAVAQSVGIAPAWVALCGAAALAVRSLRHRHTSVSDIARSANVSFLVFVLALGVVVQAVMLNGMDRAMSLVLPSGSDLPALLAIAAIAAALANVVNNLPATLVLLPLVAPSGPVAVLAVLIGVNIGPNLTYVGSLSNLLWRRVLRQHDVDAGVGEYTRLGVCTVPASLAVAVLALWASARLLGL